MFENSDSDSDGELYYNYVETTVDSGKIAFILALIICICTLLALPCTVACGRSYHRRKDHCKEGISREELDHTFDADEDHEGAQRPTTSILVSRQDEVPPPPSSASAPTPFFDPILSRYPSMDFRTQDNISARPPSTAENPNEPTPLDIYRRRRRGVRGENLGRRRLQVARGIAGEGRASVIRRQGTGNVIANGLPPNPNVSILVDECGVEACRGPPSHTIPNNRSRTMVPLQAPRTISQQSNHSSARDRSTTRDDNPKETTCDPNSLLSCCRPTNIRKSFDFVVNLAEFDYETKRILRLAIPFTLSMVIESVVDLVELATISFYIGTEAMVAFALVDIIVGITSEFMGGFIESVSSLTSMAYGAGNNHLAGQHVQLCCCYYTLFQIPCIFLWSFVMGDVMLLMGFDEYTASISQQFARIGIFIDMFEGISEGYYDFLEVIGKEVYSNVLGSLEAISEMGLVAFFAVVFDVDLVIIGAIMLLNIAFFFLINTLISTWKGWIKPFKNGLVGSCAFKNHAASRQVFKTAIPLAFGNLMAYAEWEILTIFAAYLGAAEAASWAILSFIWDMFEATTEGIGDAAEVRCAYHLGKGRPEMAKKSAYKSLYIATILAFFATSIFFIMGEDLPTWLTYDPTLQHMLADLIPIVGLSNITMTMGMVCWALIGSQARYRLATSIALSCSWLILLPLGAIMTYGLNIDLQGLAFAVVVGYAVAANILSTTLILSDWEKLSEIIRGINAITGEIDSSDSDSDIVSSSSSSSRSSSSSSSITSSSGAPPPPQPRVGVTGAIPVHSSRSSSKATTSSSTTSPPLSGTAFIEYN